MPFDAGELGQLEVEAVAGEPHHADAQRHPGRVGQDRHRRIGERRDVRRQPEHLGVKRQRRLDVVGGVDGVHEADDRALEFGLSGRRASVTTTLSVLELITLKSRLAS